LNSNALNIARDLVIHTCFSCLLTYLVSRHVYALSCPVLTSTLLCFESSVSSETLLTSTVSGDHASVLSLCCRKWLAGVETIYLLPSRFVEAILCFSSI